MVMSTQGSRRSLPGKSLRPFRLDSSANDDGRGVPDGQDLVNCWLQIPTPWVGGVVAIRVREEVRSRIKISDQLGDFIYAGCRLHCSGFGRDS